MPPAPAEYDGQRLMISVNAKENGVEVPDEEQQKRLVEAKEKAEEAGGYIEDDATLYPGFTVKFKKDAVHTLDSLKNVSVEDGHKQVNAS